MLGDIRLSSITWDSQSSAAGAAAGTTLVDATLTTQPSYQGQLLKLLDGDAVGQVRPIALHAAGGNTLTVANPFTDAAGAAVQVVAGTRYMILTPSGGGGGAAGPAPSVGLWRFGRCDTGMVASTNAVVCPNLAGFPDDIFSDEFWMQVIKNDNAAATAPEREIRRITDYVGATGAFTVDAFSADVEADDNVSIFHESIMAIEILGFGTLDTSSATVPADSARPGLYAWETDNYFNGCLLMTTEGAVRFQPRRIVDYTDATGVFALDANNPFTAAPGLVDYIIIGGQCEFVPGVDGTNNTIPSDAIGNKADTALQTLAADASLMRYIKGLITGQIRQLFYPPPYWSDPQEEVAIPGAAGTLALPSVTIADLPAGATVVRAIAMLKYHAVENTNAAANKLDGATVADTSQVLQVRDDTPGTWRDAMNFVDDQFGLSAAAREGGDVLIGSIDIAVEVVGNDTYNFQYLLAKADLAAINLNDVQVGLAICYSV